VAADRDISLRLLQSRLGHSFADRELLRLALTHRRHGSRNNERLEFLGDSLLNFVIAEELFRRFPRQREGELSRLRARLVCGETLAGIAREFELGESLTLGAGELRSGGRERDSIMADTMEALVAAIYLDSDMARMRERVLAWYGTRIDKLNPAVSHKDPKTELQEFLQARRAPLPSYEIVEASGQAHAQEFTVQCAVTGLAEPVTGRGRSRRLAEQQAAREALRRLRETE